MVDYWFLYAARGIRTHVGIIQEYTAPP
jgi:hypothetical protein